MDFPPPARRYFHSLLSVSLWLGVHLCDQSRQPRKSSDLDLTLAVWEFGAETDGRVTNVMIQMECANRSSTVLFKNALRVKTHVGVTQSGKPTAVHQPRPSSRPSVRPRGPAGWVQLFWRHLFSLRCVDLNRVASGRSGASTYRKQQVNQAAREEEGGGGEGWILQVDKGSP